jgi:hypothetical protein
MEKVEQLTIFLFKDYGEPLNMKMYIYKVIRMGLHFTMDLRNILSSIMKKDSISH